MIFDSDVSKVKCSLNFEFDSWMLRSISEDTFLHIGYISSKGYIYTFNFDFRFRVAAVCMI